MFGYKPNPSISQYGFQCFILPMIKKYSLSLDLKKHKAIMSRYKKIVEYHIPFCTKSIVFFCLFAAILH